MNNWWIDFSIKINNVVDFTNKGNEIARSKEQQLEQEVNILESYRLSSKHLDLKRI
jgi:hypothetical protein